MLTNPVKAKLKAGEVVAGPIIAEARSIGTVKLMAREGFDFLFLDMEHALFNWETILTLVQSALVMDIGAPGPCLDGALEAIGFDGFRERQAAARAAGRRLGMGVAGYVEGTGIGPPETAVLTIDADARVTVMVATSAQGQGHRTTLAQVAAEELHVPLDSVTVRQGDTSLPAQGNGAVASRTTPGR